MATTFDPNNTSHTGAMKDLYGGLKGMISSGDELGAKKLYAQKQGEFGFSNADFSNYGTGGAFSADQLSQWGANPLDNAGVDRIVGGVRTMLSAGDSAGAKTFYNESQKSLGFKDSDVAYKTTYNFTKPDGTKAIGTYTPQQIAEWKVNPAVAGSTATTGTTSAGNSTTNTTGTTTGGATTGTAKDASGTPTLGFNLSNIAQADQWKVDPATQTIEGRLQNLLNSDNPLMIQARTRALQQQNANGRLNSSMAASAADSAMYDAAIQIAGPDAQMYAENARFNTGENNTFGRDANQFLREGVMADFNLRANDWAADRTQARTLTRDEIQQGYTLARDKINNDFTLTRDDRANAFTTARDSALHSNALERDQILNSNTNDRDARLQQNTLDRDRINNDYTKDVNAASNTTATKAAATQRLNGARADFMAAMNSIQSSDMEPEDKTRLINDNMRGFNVIIKGAMAELGITDQSWLLEASAAPASTGGNGSTDSTTPIGETRYENNRPERWNGTAWVPM